MRNDKSGWYFVPIKLSCEAPGCKKPATVHLFNARNADMGKFCFAHAKASLRASELLALWPSARPGGTDDAR